MTTDFPDSTIPARAVPAVVVSDKTLILRTFPLEKKAGEPDMRFAGVSMPVGSEPICIYSKGGDMFDIAAMVPASATVRVWHDLYVAVADEPATPLLGRTFGKSLGLFPIAGQPAALLPLLPWPTSEIDAIRA